MFDTPENRALIYVIEQLQVLISRTGMAHQDDSQNSWQNEIRELRLVLTAARRVQWIRDIPAERPDERTRKRLAAARSQFYARTIPDLIDLIHECSEKISAERLTEILIMRYFEPNLDWQLFELVVSLRIAKSIAAISQSRKKTRLLTRSTSSGPFAHYIVDSEVSVKLWYQSWPDASGVSQHQLACQQYSIVGALPRPDLVVEVVEPDTSWGILIEMKATRSASYLSQGVLQILGYLADRPHLFAHEAAGWLVAPRSEAFVSVPAEGSIIWAVPAEEVATAIANACLSRRRDLPELVATN